MLSCCCINLKNGVVYVALMFTVSHWISYIVAFSAYLILEQDIYLEVAPDEDEYLFYGRWFLIAAGLTMIGGGITGCIGGVKQSSCLLRAFFSIVLIILLAELSAGIFIFAEQDEISKYFRTQMKNSLQTLYGVDEYRTKGWDLLQKELQCCGATRYNDYSSNVLQRQVESYEVIDMRLSSKSVSSYNVPKSCCRIDLSDSHCENSRSISRNDGLLPSNTIFEKGCHEKLIEWIKSKSPYFILALVGIGTIQIFCLFFTCVLICKYRSRRFRYKP